MTGNKAKTYNPINFLIQYLTDHIKHLWFHSFRVQYHNVNFYFLTTSPNFQAVILVLLVDCQT